MAIHPLPYGSDQPARKVGSGLDRVVRSLGLPSAGSVSSIFGDWEQIVGVEIAQHCRPVALKRGVLTLLATDQAWATELQWMESALVQACQRVLEDAVVTSVKVTQTAPRSR